MRVSPDIELGQQQCPGGLAVGWDALSDDQRFGLLSGVLELDLFAWPAAVVANTVGDAPFQRLTGLCTAHDDGVVPFKALFERFVVAPA